MTQRILEQIDSVVAEINACVAEKSWMDFHVSRYETDTLVLSGGADAARYCDLRIAFQQVAWASLHFRTWSCDGSRPLLHRAEGEDADAVRERFQIDVGDHLFRIVAHDLSEPMWVAARGIIADTHRVKVSADDI